MQDTCAANSFRCGPDQNDRVGCPRFFATRVAKSAVKLNHRLAVLPNRHRRAEFAMLFKIFAEQRIESITKCFKIELHKVVGDFCEPRKHSGLTQTPYSSSSSNSPSRRSNNCSVRWVGADFVMSTPAAFNVSSGNLEPPERKNFR